MGFGCLMPALSAHTGDCYSAPPCPFQVLDLEILMLYDVTSEDINTSRPLLRHQFFTFMLILVTSTSMFTKHETPKPLFLIKTKMLKTRLFEMYNPLKILQS